MNLLLLVCEHECVIFGFSKFWNKFHLKKLIIYLDMYLGIAILDSPSLEQIIMQVSKTFCYVFHWMNLVKSAEYVNMNCLEFLLKHQFICICKACG